MAAVNTRHLSYTMPRGNTSNRNPYLIIFVIIVSLINELCWFNGVGAGGRSRDMGVGQEYCELGGIWGHGLIITGQREYIEEGGVQANFLVIYDEALCGTDGL